MDISLKTYKKDFTHSYSVGVFPALELITYRPRSIIKILLHSRAGRNSGVDKIRDFAVTNAIPVETNDLAINKLSHSENCYAVGIFNKYTTPLSPTDNHLVLVNPEDMGNLGTIIRTMLGFGIRDLALIKPAPDIFDPKVIRASMGAVFSANITYFDDFLTTRIYFPDNIIPL
jgi:TrmH family RNA methyltransferase